MCLFAGLAGPTSETCTPPAPPPPPPRRPPARPPLVAATLLLLLLLSFTRPCHRVAVSLFVFLLFFNLNKGFPLCVFLRYFKNRYVSHNSPQRNTTPLPCLWPWTRDSMGQSVQINPPTNQQITYSVIHLLLLPCWSPPVQVLPVAPYPTRSSRSLHCVRPASFFSIFFLPGDLLYLFPASSTIRYHHDSVEKDKGLLPVCRSAVF